MATTPMHDASRIHLLAAEQVRSALAEAGVGCVRLRGGPGCGKTRLIEATLRHLPQIRFAVVTSTAEAEDRLRLRDLCDQVVEMQLEPDTAPAPQDVQAALARVDLPAADVLIFEDAGPLAVGADVGLDTSVGVFSVAGGSDKACKHPDLIRAASLVVLNKTDLLPHTPFDLDRFRADVARLAPGVRIVELSALEHSRLGDWLDWIASIVPAGRQNHPVLPAEFFFG